MSPYWKVYENEKACNLIKNFSRAKSIEFMGKTKQLQILKNLSKNLVRVEELGILGDSPEEFELLTNPEYYKYGIKYLKYLFKSEHEITDQTFLNIKEIHPKNLMFYDKNE